MTKKSHLVVIGFGELVSNKYISCFREAIEKNYIDSYSVIDIESQKDSIVRRLKTIEPQPENVFYLPDLRQEKIWASRKDFEPILKMLIGKKGSIKVYIATELKAHEAYLRFCVENGIDSLTEKPIFAPMKDGRFNPSSIQDVMNEIIDFSKKHPAKHSVMTLSRYHKIYNTVILDSLRQRMIEWKAPLTSFHFRTAGGVWNRHEEYESRGDHPYRDGYGMLMHGAYHYIDLTAQFLILNKLIYPRDTFTLTVSSFAAYPADQNDRISKVFSDRFDDNKPDWASLNKTIRYGETDIVTVFCLKNKKTSKVVTVGTISLEQTTPSIRSWKNLPENSYNKNGRVSSVNLEAQLSTLYSVRVDCFDVPVVSSNKLDRIDAFARVSTRANASLLENEVYNSEEIFSGLFHSDSNRNLLLEWLKGTEEKSRLETHIPAMLLTQVVAESLIHPGHPITIDFI